MYDGVPSTEPGRDSIASDRLRSVQTAESSLGRIARSSSAMPPWSRTFARPQSMTCTSPKLPTMMFDGFRSRWTTPRAWA